MGLSSDDHLRGEVSVSASFRVLFVVVMLAWVRQILCPASAAAGEPQCAGTLIFLDDEKGTGWHYKIEGQSDTFQILVPVSYESESGIKRSVLKGHSSITSIDETEIFGCLSPGHYVTQISFTCYKDDLMPIPGQQASAEFEVPDDHTVHLQADLIVPPTPSANIKLSYSFPKLAGTIRVFVDGAGQSDALSFKPQYHSGTINVLLPPGDHILQATSCVGLHNGSDLAASHAFLVPSNAPARSLRGAVLTDALPVYDQRTVSQNEIDVTVALGSRFTLGVLAGVGLGASFVESTRERVSAIVTKPLAALRLFDDEAVVDIGSATAVNHEFLATHLGATNWELSTGTGAPVLVTINVTPPARLGTTENTWDARIVDVAHKTGILPQLVKGQMAQESPNGKTFDPFGYRYEPCGADLKYMSSKIGTAPYVDYRAPNPRGVDLQDGDLNPRNRYWLGAPSAPARRKLSNADVDITARQIWDGNNITTKSGPPHGQRWDQLCKPSVLAAINEPNSTTLDFVAQTPTASSYGLFQVMYDTAVHEWPGALVNGARVKAPRYLFDTEDNFSVDGGTMLIANLFMVKHFTATQPNSFSTYADFEAWVLKSYKKYNSKHPTYPGGVVGHSLDFLPVGGAGMFQ